MAKNKNQIITEINTKIVENGNIKAVDTNTILKDILNCPELNNSSTTNKFSTFSFKNEKVLVDKRGAKLNYSMRGIKEHFVSITFEIAILETDVNQLSFEVKDLELISVLEQILSKDKVISIDFLVSIKNTKPANTVIPFRIGNLNFFLQGKNISIKIEPQSRKENLLEGDTISTSFTVHTPIN